MRKILIFSLLAGIVSAILGCQETDESGHSTIKSLPGADTIRISLSVERLDSTLFSCSSPEQVSLWMNAHASFVEVYFPKNEFPDRKQLVQELFKRINEPSLREFYKQTNESFGQFNSLKSELTTAFRNMKAYDPAFSVPKVQVIFTGFMGADLIIRDSVLVIGMDYFLGPKAKFRPDVYAYQLWRYTPQALVPQILFISSERYTKNDPTDKTLLAEMVNYGKGYAFAQTMLPQTPDSLLIGYTGKQLAETHIAQDLVWGHFIDQKLLYETNPLKKVRYVGERPQTPEIGPRCPGGIGRWVGWQIVRYYQENNSDVSLKELMNNTNARQILEASKYRGQTEQ